MTAAAVVASLVLAAPASAEVRSGSVSDPRDLAPHPKSFEADLAEVGGRYEGLQLRVTLRFHNGPWVGDGMDLDAYRGPSGDFRLTFGQRVDDGRCVIGQPGDAVVEGLYSPDIDQVRLSIVGQDQLEYSRDSSRNESNAEITFFVASGALGSRDYRCVSGISATGGGQTDAVAGFYFAGFAPSSPSPTVLAGSTGLPGAPGAPGVPGVTGPAGGAGVPGATVTSTAARRLSARATLRGRSVRVRVACSTTRRGSVRVAWRGGATTRVARCRAGRSVLLRVVVPRSVRAALVTVSLGRERVTRAARRR